ncbi:MAG TPA: LCP family protein, partial [Acidimicrobiales bacterium]|nr:LCP family protein [Acidimicrobiales bacterium]
MSRSDITRIRKQASVYRSQQRWKKRASWSIIASVAVLVLGVGGIYAYAQYRYHQIHRLNVGHLVSAGSDQPMNILMVGNNSRCTLNGNQSNAFGTCSQVAGARSDVIMILHLDPKARTESILSIPRDMLAPVPGVANELKIDSALNYGPERLVQTIEDDFGITINHFIELNFDSFQGVVS